MTSSQINSMENQASLYIPGQHLNMEPDYQVLEKDPLRTETCVFLVSLYRTAPSKNLKKRICNGMPPCPMMCGKSSRRKMVSIDSLIQLANLVMRLRSKGWMRMCSSKKRNPVQIKPCTPSPKVQTNMEVASRFLVLYSNGPSHINVFSD